ncbi:MAG: family 43 glycosylhydrolase [Mogibacterium sp.]|nr:family 43 glycosylhydrolase [Mogibacterium sp.]
MLKTNEINIRDPFVLVHDSKYYLYGTRSATCWGPADGFDCYVSDDRESWEGPVEIFHRPEGFFADAFYWAPECYEYKGKFYLVVTLGTLDNSIKKGTYILRADEPDGPFSVWSSRITPEDWTCIDATLYFEDDEPWIVFSHSFEDPGSLDGDYCLLKLAGDLKTAAGHEDGSPAQADEIVTLFSAKECPWATPVPFAKAEFGIDGDCYFSDGPSLLMIEGRLYMINSSWSGGGYAVGAACSESGSVRGPWRIQDKPLYPENGGHGMFFRDKNEEIIFTLHYPNDKYKERPVFMKISEADGVLSID